MKPTNGMDRGQFHDKAWALWQAKALDDAKLPKLSIYAIRTLWDVLFDSMPAESKVAQPVEQTRAMTDERRKAIEYAVRWMDENVSNRYAHTALMELRSILSEASVTQSAITVDLAEVEKAERAHLAELTAAFQTHTFRANTTNSLDDIDASVFSGDEFVGDKLARMAFRWYLARWERQLKLNDKFDEEDAQ